MLSTIIAFILKVIEILAFVVFVGIPGVMTATFVIIGIALLLKLDGVINVFGIIFWRFKDYLPMFVYRRIYVVNNTSVSTKKGTLRDTSKRSIILEIPVTMRDLVVNLGGADTPSRLEYLNGNYFFPFSYTDVRSRMYWYILKPVYEQDDGSNKQLDLTIHVKGCSNLMRCNVRFYTTDGKLKLQVEPGAKFPGTIGIVEEQLPE